MRSCSCGEALRVSVQRKAANVRTAAEARQLVLLFIGADCLSGPQFRQQIFGGSPSLEKKRQAQAWPFSTSIPHLNEEPDCGRAENCSSDPWQWCVRQLERIADGRRRWRGNNSCGVVDRSVHQ